VEPPLALFIAAVPAFKILSDSALPRAIRVVGELLDGAPKPFVSNAEGMVALGDRPASQASAPSV
jgi:hypothetical protein